MLSDIYMYVHCTHHLLFYYKYEVKYVHNYVSLGLIDNFIKIYK